MPKRKRKYPVKGHLNEFTVAIWEERDRVRIDLLFRDDEVASWIDEAAAEMFTDGFFVANRGEAALERSVLEYAENVGLIKILSPSEIAAWPAGLRRSSGYDASGYPLKRG